MRAKCSDQEFIALHQKHQSPTKVAKELGISLRAVQKRKGRIERDYKVVLPVDDPRPAYAKGQIDHERAVYSLEIQDGEILIASDIHIWPGERTTMQRAFLKFVRERKPQAVILNGDVFDGARISRYPSIGWEKKPTVKQELDAVADYLGDLLLACGKAKRIRTAGNHDLRFESRIAASLPELEGVQGVHLKDHFPEWLPCWRCDINSDVIVRHRELGGEHADYRNVQTQGVTLITGHDHRTGVVPYRSYRGVHFGVRCGYMGESPLDPQFVHYLEGKVPNWHPAFVILTFKDGRLLWPELVNKHDDEHVDFRGQVIPV